MQRERETHPHFTFKENAQNLKETFFQQTNWRRRKPVTDSDIFKIAKEAINFIYSICLLGNKILFYTHTAETCIWKEDERCIENLVATQNGNRDQVVQKIEIDTNRH